MDQTLFVAMGQNVTVAMAAAGVILLAVGLLVGILLGRGKRTVAPVAAGKGLKQARDASDDAFLKGLTHLMADHTDQAIEEFTKAVNLNSDTVETYVVLGNLFRQKGEIDRAVRIRQTIIARLNLDRAVQIQARYDLGLDYRKGGLFNRAVEAFQEVLAQDSSHVDATAQLVSLYEEMRDWAKAYDTLRKLDKITGKDSRLILAHYKTEQGKELAAEGKLDAAEQAMSQAINVHKKCIDAYLHLGDLELSRGRNRKAINLWRKAVGLAPLHAHLVIDRMDKAESTLGEKAVLSFFNEINLDTAEVTALLALARSRHGHGDDPKALELLNKAIAKDPGCLEAHQIKGDILLAMGDQSGCQEAYVELLAQVHGFRTQYQCGNCGFVAQHLTWKCPRCHNWDTMTPYRG